MEFWSTAKLFLNSCSSFIYSYLQNFIFNHFNELINLSKTIKQAGNWLKKTYVTSVDTTEIYYDKFNLTRYLVCWLHFLLIIVSLIITILLTSNNWLFHHLIDNTFLPKNFKIIILYLILISIMTISYRFDFLLAEWNGTISMFKIYYYLGKNINSEHRLTHENYTKLLILTEFLYVICIKICLPFVFSFISLFYLYIAIMSNKIVLQLITPFVFYVVWLIISTAFLGASLATEMIYYYILLFKQINQEFSMIYQQTKLFISMTNQKKLVLLAEKHDNFAIEMNKINLMSRKTVLGFFIVLSLGLIIPLNLFLKSDNRFEQIIYFIVFIVSLLYGFAIAYLMSNVIRITHKPYKIIYQILRKQNFIFNSKRNFNYKWKVIKHNTFFNINKLIIQFPDAKLH